MGHVRCPGGSHRDPVPVKRTPLTRKTALRGGGGLSPRKARRTTSDGRTIPWGSTLPAVSRKRIETQPVRDAARLAVWERTAAAQGCPWLVRCTFDHDHPLMAGCSCTAPEPDHFTGLVLPRSQRRGSPEGWEPDRWNRGYLALCHVLPVALAGPLAWDTHNLFVGCDGGNEWAEDHVAEAVALGIHAHMGDHVFEGRRVAA